MSQYSVRREQRKQAAFNAAYLKANKKPVEMHRLVLSKSADNNINLRLLISRPLYGYEEDEVLGYLSGEPNGLDLDYMLKLQTFRNRPRNRPARYGSKGITRQAKRTVREACALLEKRYSLNVGFLTLTLPGSTARAKFAFAEHLPGMLNLYFTKVRKQCARFCGRPNEQASSKVARSYRSKLSGGSQEGENTSELDYVSVTELQKRGALHMHVAIGLYNKEMFDYIRRKQRKWWCQVLETFSTKLGVDLFEREEGGTWRNNWRKVQTKWVKVEKSIKRYLSKYLSKGSIHELSGGVATPRRWWNISRQLRRDVVEAREEFTANYWSVEEFEKASYAVQEMLATDAAASFETRNPFTGQVCGYVNYFEEGGEDFLYEVARSLLSEPAGREAIEEICEMRPPPGGDWSEETAANQNFIYQLPTPHMVCQ